MLCNTTKEQFQAYLTLPLFNQLFRCPTSSLTISFAESGDPDGIPVVVLIGLGCHRLFAALFHQLAAKWKLRFIVIDRPGYGRSDSMPIEERVAGYPVMLEELFTYLNLTTFSLICQSCGTIPGLAYSLAYPARLAGHDVHLVSPWIPTSVSKTFGWARFIPTPMIAQSHFIPLRINLPHSIQVLFNAHPAAGHVAFAQQALVSAIFKLANQERVEGQSQDLLMCIERGRPWPFQFWDVKEKGVRVKIYQGTRDGIVSCHSSLFFQHDQARLRVSHTPLLFRPTDILLYFSRHTFPSLYSSTSRRFIRPPWYLVPSATCWRGTSSSLKILSWHRIRMIITGSSRSASAEGLLQLPLFFYSLWLKDPRLFLPQI
ncbi:Alpha/Beta hydrolase protein, partial [Endogone sp. FLAS-F59071]